MGCASCEQKNQGNGYLELKALQYPPFGAAEISVYDANTKEIRKLQVEDWNPKRHKLLLFFPETFTPVCETEMGALNDWIAEFDKLDCDVFAATTDPSHAVREWYENDDVLKKSKYKVLSTFILPARLGILNGGRAKRASVFITKEGEVLIHEHFLKVGRSIEELHRTMFAYTTDSYCAEGWKSPSDGFLDGNAPKN